MLIKSLRFLSEGNSCPAVSQVPDLCKSKKTCLPWLLMPGIGPPWYELVLHHPGSGLRQCRWLLELLQPNHLQSNLWLTSAVEMESGVWLPMSLVHGGACFWSSSTSTQRALSSQRPGHRQEGCTFISLNCSFATEAWSKHSWWYFASSHQDGYIFAAPGLAILPSFPFWLLDKDKHFSQHFYFFLFFSKKHFLNWKYEISLNISWSGILCYFSTGLFLESGPTSSWCWHLKLDLFLFWFYISLFL